jgi:hypothetical protein
VDPITLGIHALLVRIVVSPLRFVVTGRAAAGSHRSSCQQTAGRSYGGPRAGVAGDGSERSAESCAHERAEPRTFGPVRSGEMARGRSDLPRRPLATHDVVVLKPGLE